MGKNKHFELLSGSLSLVFAVIAVLLVCFAPLIYSRSGSTKYGQGTTVIRESEKYMSYIEAHGWNSIAFVVIFLTAIFVFFFLSVVLDVFIHRRYYKWLLWAFCIIILVTVLLSAASIGMFLLPSFVLAIVTAIIATRRNVNTVQLQ